MKNLPPLEAEKVRLNPPANMNLQEAAAYVGVHVDTLWEAKNKRLVRCARVGRRIIFQRVELDRWLSNSAESA